ncbi:MAG: outer rane biosis protein BamB [Verrucomicrobiales bacterium]|nr:outer rane biosis protein BamB [Verrucomicrobiales bacterium]
MSKTFSYMGATSFFCLAFCLSTSPVFAAPAWPQFRGPNGAGVAEKDKPPAVFGPTTNMLFQVSVPPGASSPSIWGNRLFLTALEGGKLETICLDRRDGKVLWKKLAPAEKLEAFHPTEGSPAASTPATDGNRVYVYFGSCGLLAYDLNGKELWHVPMPPATHVGDFGTGTSPIIYRGAVVLNRDMLAGSSIMAVNAKTGKLLWKQERPQALSSYSTPVIWQHDGKAEVVVASSQRMQAYDLKTGQGSWQVQGLPNATCTTPVLGDGLLFFAGWSPGAKETRMPSFSDLVEKADRNKDGALQKPEIADNQMLALLFTLFDMNGDGKIVQEEWDTRSKTMSQGDNALMAVDMKAGAPKVLWKQTRGLPYVPSPLFYKGLLYIVKDGGMASCFDAKTGKPHYEQERIGSTGTYYSSPVAADGRIYIVSATGKVTIFSAGEKAEVLGKADLGERCITTPAIAENALYFRTSGHLWAFGKEKK